MAETRDMLNNTFNVNKYFNEESTPTNGADFRSMVSANSREQEMFLETLLASG
jgi:hypothetical protein